MRCKYPIKRRAICTKTNLKLVDEPERMLDVREIDEDCWVGIEWSGLQNAIHWHVE